MRSKNDTLLILGNLWLMGSMITNPMSVAMFGLGLLLIAAYLWG